MKKLLLQLGLALTLSACMGNAVNAQAVCLTDGTQLSQITGDCSRTIETLDDKETQRITIQTTDVIPPFATVDFEVTVESGTVEVTFVDSRGNTQTSQATPSQPATGSVVVQLDPLNQIKFDLAPVDGDATNVEYQLNFVCECMP